MRIASVFSVSLVAFTGCTSGTAPIDEVEIRREALRQVHTEVVAPTYRTFVERSAALEAAATAFCASPDLAGLTATREAWWAAREPWKNNEIVNFGPVVDEPFRFGPPIDFWPVREDVVDDLLAGDASLSVADVAGFGASTRGFPVLDYILWGSAADDAGHVDAFSDPRRCTYLVSLSTDLNANATGLADAWDDYADQLSDPTLADVVYASQQEVVDEWVNRMLFALADIRAEKLGKPLGDDSQGTPLPDAAESAYSGRSLLDARDAYQGVENVYEGGLRDLMPPERTPVGFFEDFLARREAARAALADIPEPLGETVFSQPQSIVDAQQAIREVQVMIQVDVSQALGVTLAFNDNDGD